MITCKNATFIHVPKCGGTYFRRIIRPNFVSHEECALPTQYSQRPMIGFIRNPYSWYVSWYNFCNTGSDMHKTLDIYTVCNKGEIQFDLFLKNLITPTLAFKQRYLSVLQAFDPKASLLQIAALWLKSDKAFYEHLYDCYLADADMVYKNETMTQDIPKILDGLGILTPEITLKLETTPHINISKKVNYRDYYTPELVKLVADNHQRILTKYNYTL